ncbi:MAG: glycosyltransferase family 2 protein [Verrucomicrobiota bacterium]|nr:glycosyltransferase family 2 protein [Verrucomicrobiota bacterium]
MSISPQITALVHTRNEENQLAGCLESLQWADELLVADMASTDQTRSIAVRFGARVLEMPVLPIVEKVRNLALAQCTHDWVFILDADERATPALANGLRNAIKNSEAAAAFTVPRKNYFLGTWLEHGCWPDPQTRLVRKGLASWSGLIHEHPEIKGPIHHLPPDPEAAIEHTGYVLDLGKFLEKQLRYSRLDAERLKQNVAPPIWPWLLRRPVSEFLGRYFASGAWRHGMHGLVWSLCMGLYEAQVAINYWDLQRSSAQLTTPSSLRRKVRFEALRTAIKFLRP